MSKFGKAKYLLEGSWPELRAKLALLRDSDMVAEKNTSAAGKMAAGGCLSVVIGMVSAAFFPLAALFLFGGFALLIFGAVWYSMASSYDLENQRYELPLQMLDTIAVDLDQKKPISLWIDFRASQSKPFITNVERPSFLFFSYGTKTSTFSHDWLELSATTVEGHRVKLKITRSGTLKETPKRKRTKTKLRYSDSVVVNLRPPDAASLQPQTGVVAPPMRCNFRALGGQCTERGVVVRGSGPVSWEVRNRSTSKGGEQLTSRDVVLVLMSAFRALQRNPGAQGGSPPVDGPATVHFATA